ncbi:hypothetical protein SAY86_005014 [Trapa natans]|uniref:glucan endo-1,3-beta-D-glucosidase n=1 Tax=Trapa natans TaxID=22666 RepID=A0AAN7QSY0_TRANT|nr:hypothetical protein SAY86_005014 [Trapa natans]
MHGHSLVGGCTAILFLVGLANGLGVNWGTMSSHHIEARIVVQMLKDNGINKVKLFDANPRMVRALAGTGIEVMLGIPNDQLANMAFTADYAKDWVKENVTQNLDDGVIIKYVAVGNEPFLTSYNGTNLESTLPALQNIQMALDEAGHGGTIKATVPHNADVYESPSNKPSDGRFRNDIKAVMVKMVKFLQQHKSPFLVNIYPFLSLQSNAHFPFDFAFCDNTASPIGDNGAQYADVFDANYDTLAWSLKKAGAPDMKILVGEIGWPTDGVVNGNVALARRFYAGFLKKMAAGKGTPLRPGRIEFYLFSLLDEDLKSIQPGFFERHWGIFRFDGQAKFHIDFSGKGRQVMPVGAKGVTYQTEQWCVVDPSKTKDKEKVGKNLNYACTIADCTSLAYGSSCNDMDFLGNVSYAFNQYFQAQDQDVESCGFNGMAMVVTQNASRGNCLFPIMIVNSGFRLVAGGTWLAGFLSSLVSGMLLLSLRL